MRVKNDQVCLLDDFAQCRAKRVFENMKLISLIKIFGVARPPKQNQRNNDAAQQSCPHQTVAYP